MPLQIEPLLSLSAALTVCLQVLLQVITCVMELIQLNNNSLAQINLVLLTAVQL